MPENKSNEFIRKEFQSVSKINKDYKKNPFEKYSGTFSASFSTIVLGLMLGIIGLVILGYSEGIDNVLNSVRRSPLIHEENLLRTSGMIKLVGQPTVRQELKVPGFDDELIYYKKITEEKINGEWVEVGKQQVFASFSIGKVYIDALNADLQFDLVEIYKNEEGDKRESVYGVLAKDEIVVVGNLKNNSIADGVVFVVTNKSNKDLIDSMSSVDTRSWWLYKVGALLLITLGLTAFVLPILTFIDILPKIGLFTIGTILLFSLLVSALLVFISAVIITFWWLIFVVVGFVIILLIRIKSKKKYSAISFIP